MANVVSIRSTIPRQSPSFIQEDHPLFVKFVEAYFEYLERESGPVSFVRDALTYVDPSETLDSFITDFFEEMKGIPNVIAADKRLLAQHIYDLYQAKGTIKSFELFFRMVYGENVSVYFPKDDILRVSDGKWSRDIRIRAKLITGDPFGLIGNIIYQSVANDIVCSANVENVVGIGNGLYDIFLSPNTILGDFSSDRLIQFGLTELSVSPVPEFSISGRGAGVTSGTNVSVLGGDLTSSVVGSVLSGSITKVFILDGGTGHYVGEQFTVTSTTGQYADIRVATVSNGSVTGINIINGGQGYQTFPTISLSDGKFFAVGDRIGAIGEILVDNPGINHVSPPDVFVDTNILISDPSYQFNNNEPIDVLLDLMITETESALVMEDGSYLLSETNDSATFDISIYSVNGNTAKIKGTIEKIGLVTEDGFTFRLENGGDLLTERSSGSISGKTIVGRSSGCVARVLFASPASVKSTLSAIYSSVSKFTNSDGKISEATKRIQDSRYYQEFSYVIKSGQSISLYQNAIRNLIHPAGLAMFGSIAIESKIDVVSNLVAGLANIVTQILLGYGLLKSNLVKNVLTIETEILVKDTNQRDYRWLDMYKFSLGDHPAMFVGNKRTNQISVVATQTLDQYENLRIQDISTVTFDDIYSYDFSTLGDYVASGYVVTGYVESGLGSIDNYLSPAWESDYYRYKNGSLNITWNSCIETFVDVSGQVPSMALDFGNETYQQI